MFKLITIAVLALTTQAVKLHNKTHVHTSLKAAVAQGMDATPEEIHAWFDVNGDGNVTEQEFMDQLEGLAAEYEHEVTEKERSEALGLYKFADADGDGLVTLEEVVSVVKKLEDMEEESE